MLSTVKALLPFGAQARAGKFLTALQSRIDTSNILAMQAVAEWLNKPSTRSQIQDDGLILLQAVDEPLRQLAKRSAEELIGASTNQAKTTLLLRSLVPFCSLMRDIYGGLLARDIVEVSRKAGNASLVRDAVASWLFWNGRSFFAHFVQDHRASKLPWHEIQPTVSYALALPTTRPDGQNEAELAGLRRQLASLVLLSRSLSADLQGRQLLIAERVAESFADLTKVSTQHSAATPFGHAANDNSPPTVLSRLPTRGVSPARGLFYGLDDSVQELVRLEYQIKLHNALPAALDGVGQIDVAEVLTVINHLKQRWSGQRVQRRSERRKLAGKLAVIHGVAQITDALQPLQPRRPFSNDPATGYEPGEIIDASVGGIGIRLTRHGGWLKVGQLVGFKVDAEPHWRLGMVRRAVLLGHREMQAGVQLLGRDPSLVQMRKRTAVGARQAGSEIVPQAQYRSLFVQTASADGKPQHLFISATPDLEVGQTYEVDQQNAQSLVRISGVAELGNNCVLYYGQPTPPATAKTA